MLMAVCIYIAGQSYGSKGEKREKKIVLIHSGYMQLQVNTAIVLNVRSQQCHDSS